MQREIGIPSVLGFFMYCSRLAQVFIMTCGPTSSDPKHPTAEAQKTYPVGLGVSRHGMAGKVLSTYLMWWPRLHSS